MPGSENNAIIQSGAGATAHLGAAAVAKTLFVQGSGTITNNGQMIEGLSGMGDILQIGYHFTRGSLNTGASPNDVEIGSFAVIDYQYQGLNQIAAVPEPATLCSAFAGLACGGVSLWRRRRTRGPA